VYPQTFRGGGFLYYSRSNEGEEISSPQQKRSNDENQGLAQSQQNITQLVLNHPKMKGDNLICLVRQNESFKRLPVKAGRMPTNLRHWASMKSIGARRDPMAFNSLFSKESFGLEEVEACINSGESSCRSSNIQIDKYYVIFSLIIS